MTPDQAASLGRLSAGLNVVSVMASSWVLLTFALFRSKKFSSVGAYLTCAFTAATLGLNSTFLISWLFGYPASVVNSPICSVQAAGIQFFGSLCVICWLLIAVNIYRLTRRGRPASAAASSRFLPFLWSFY